MRHFNRVCNNYILFSLNELEIIVYACWKNFNHRNKMMERKFSNKRHRIFSSNLEKLLRNNDLLIRKRQKPIGSIFFSISRFFHASKW